MCWQIITGISAVIAALIAVGTLIYAILSGRNQAKNLAKQTTKISEQTEILRKQVFSEVYDEAKIRDLQFYLPEKRKHPIEVFKDLQKEKEEINLGGIVKIKRQIETELHVHFWMDAPQKLRAISWGFIGEEYENQPDILKLKRAFVVEKTSQFERETYKDWHGHWHMEFPFSRFLPKDEVFVLCFIVKGDNIGKFQLGFNIRTEEAKNPYRGELCVEVIS